MDVFALFLSFVSFLSKFLLLQIIGGSEMVYKGIHSDIESYSSFYDNAKRAETQMRKYLKSKNITDVFVCGLALDVCVGEFLVKALPTNISFSSSTS
jgi:nicotinamidase-related amidase